MACADRGPHPRQVSSSEGAWTCVSEALQVFGDQATGQGPPLRASCATAASCPSRGEPAWPVGARPSAGAGGSRISRVPPRAPREFAAWSSQAAQDCSPKAPPLPGRDGPPWPAGWSAGVQGPQREAQTARGWAQVSLEAALRLPLPEEPLLGDSPVVWPQSSPAPLTHVPPSVMGKRRRVCLPKDPLTQVAGGGALWARDTRCQGTASSFPEELGLDQSGRDRLLCPGSSIPCHQGQAASPLKRQSWGKE